MTTTRVAMTLMRRLVLGFINRKPFFTKLKFDRDPMPICSEIASLYLLIRYFNAGHYVRKWREAQTANHISLTSHPTIR